MTDTTEQTPGTLKLCKKLFSQYPYRSVVVLLSLLIAALAEAFGVAALLPLLSMMGETQNPDDKISQALSWMLNHVNMSLNTESVLALILFLITCKAAFWIFAMRNVGYAMANMANDYRVRFAKALMHVKWDYFNALPLGEAANAVGTEAQRAGRTYMLVCKLLAESIVVVVYLSLVMLVSTELTLIAMATGFVLMMLLYKLVTVVKQAGRKQTKYMSRLSSLIADSVYAVKIIKATGREKHFAKLLKTESGHLRDAKKRQVIGNQALLAIREPVIVLFIVTGIYFAGQYTDLTLASMMTFSFMFLRIMQKITNIQVVFQGLVTDESAYWSLTKRIEATEAAAESHPGTKAPTLKKSIRFDAVTFQHANTDADEKTTTLENISCTLPVQKFNAVIGESGSGKTTLIDLVLAFYKPQAGQILIDDVLLDDIDIKEWRRSIGYVSQDSPLMHDTIYHNVTMGQDSISEKDVIEALKTAGAWPFIEELPDGIHEIVGERGLRFSGGQRQRISIARALVTQPKLLILDEATSALDKKTEKEILDNVKALSKKITVIAISHDKEVINYADNIYYLSDGHLEEKAA